MDTNDLTRERISALADGELEDAQIEVALAALRSEEARADWMLYHQIGDVLRSEDMPLTLSRNFSSSLSERLEREPVHLVPRSFVHPARRRVWPMAAGAAAVATLAFVVTSPLIDLMQPQPAATELAVAPAENAVVLTSAPEGVILRDPRIDDYLLAHQRFSPSMHHNAQYTRSANFPGK